jgi:hypothetical protein
MSKRSEKSFHNKSLRISTTAQKKEEVKEVKAAECKEIIS